MYIVIINILIIGGDSMEISNSYYLITIDTSEKFNIALELSNFFSINRSDDTSLTDIRIDYDKSIPFDYEYKNNNYSGEYLLSYKNLKEKTDEHLYLEVKLFYKNKSQGMSALSEIVQNLRNRINKYFYMISLEDSVSKYYNQLAYKYTSEYERKIRKLILLILVPEYKSEWVGQLEEISKKKKAKQTIEQGLQELDLSDLENILFDKKHNVNEKTYEEIFNIEKLKELNKHEILNIVKENSPKSFWQRYLGNYIKSDDLESKMSEIRKERNKVAHHKYFSEIQYKQLKKDINYVNRKIDQAIDLVITSDTRLDIQEMNLNIYKNIINIHKANNVYLNELGKNYIKYIENVTKPIKTFFESPAYKQAFEIQSKMKKISDMYPEFFKS